MRQTPGTVSPVQGRPSGGIPEGKHPAYVAVFVVLLSPSTAALFLVLSSSAQASLGGGVVRGLTRKRLFVLPPVLNGAVGWPPSCPGVQSLYRYVCGLAWGWMGRVHQWFCLICQIHRRVWGAVEKRWLGDALDCLVFPAFFLLLLCFVLFFGGEGGCLLIFWGVGGG